MEKDGLAKSSDTSIEKGGLISQSLSKDGIPNQSYYSTRMIESQVL